MNTYGRLGILLVLSTATLQALPPSVLYQASQRPEIFQEPAHSLSSGGLRLAWLRHYSPVLMPTNDHATAVATDRRGNLYVTGTSQSFVGDYDYLTIKYNPAGDSLWVRRFEGGSEWHTQDDRPTSIAVDEFGNVYVTGTSGTVAYDSTGTQQWVGRDAGSMVVVDHDRNAYVAGNGYVVIKYTPAGDTAWTRRYEGNSGNRATFLTVDGIGNVYVTGVTDPIYDDYWECVIAISMTTIKYTSLGDTLWVRHEPNISPQVISHSPAIAVDGGGNVYVAGTLNADYVAIKYRPNGEKVWMRFYNGPGNGSDMLTSLAVDGDGNAYVTGTSYGSDYDYATIKYSSSGDSLWVRRYDTGPGGIPDRPSALATDRQGNVYATGVTKAGYTTIKYDVGGNLAWARDHNGTTGGIDATLPSMAVDEIGNIHVSGFSVTQTLDDYTTVTYDSPGGKLWSKTYTGPGRGRNNGASAATVDMDGNFYVAAGSMVKYNTYGEIEWTGAYSGTSIAVDKERDVYVTGNGFVTTKYKPMGDTAWVRRYAAPNNSTVGAIAVDRSGCVYVSGAVEGYFLTIKYNQSGDTIWTRKYFGPSVNWPYQTSLAVDTSANVYITGTDQYNITTIKYDVNGNTVWIRTYDGPGNSTQSSVDHPTAIKVHVDGSVYVSGSTELSWSKDFVTIKYYPNGDTVWIRQFQGPKAAYGGGPSFAIDGSGNAYVSGPSANGSNMYEGNDFATIKYDKNGDTVWVRRHWGSETRTDGSIIAVDRNDNVYVTTGGVSSIGPLVFKYNHEGLEEWTIQGDAINSRSIGMGVDSNGNVFVAGNRGYGSDNIMCFAVKYEKVKVAAGKETSAIPSSCLLGQNYPNPFNPTTQIQILNPKQQILRVGVFDMLGREIAVLMNEEKAAGTHTVTWNAENHPTGVYFYQLKSGERILTRKMLLLR